MRLLLVDDDEATRDILQRLLHRLGVDITAASSAEEALTLLGQGSFDAAILDNQLQVSVGTDLAHTISQNYPGIKLVSLSGDWVQDPIFLRHLLKPVRMADLKELLDFLGFS